MYGLNLKVAILRDDQYDDDYGGRISSGTVQLYTDISGHLDYFMPKGNFTRNSGIETEKTYTFLVRPASLDIRTDDIIQIIFPPNHTDYLKRFRVRGLQKESYHPSDRRGFLDVTVIRIEESRGNNTN